MIIGSEPYFSGILCSAMSEPGHFPELLILSSSDWKDYALLDSGNGLKLERFGPYRLVRPEAEALWKPALPENEWRQMDAIFQPGREENGGHWQTTQKLPESWQMTYKELCFRIQLSASRHVGVFPEEACHWDWIAEKVRKGQKPIRVLNLFGYTGLATLAAAAAGAKVTHIDASRKVVSWARENQELSGLSERPIRWIVDDALKFVQREIRRGNQYDGLILDPPKFGRGPKGEVWEFYKLMAELLQSCRQALSPSPLFVVITAYAVKASALTLKYALSEMMQDWGGVVEAGEIVLNERSAGRLLSTSIFARWSAT